MFPVNLLAVLVAAVANFIIGFLCHGPVLGKVWMRLADIHPTGNEKFADMIPELVKNFIVDFVFAYGLAVVYLFASTSPLLAGPGVATGLVVAFIVWICFIVTSSSIGVIWMKQSSKLWLFEAFCSLLSLLAMGAIIAVW